MDGFGMNEFGLNGSQWAPRSHSGNSKYTRDDGKWTCFMCGCANSLRRRDCLPCSERTTSKNVDYRTIDYSHLHSHPSAASDNEHTRPDEARLDQTAKINGLSGTSNETHSKKLQLREPGLAMSQWAPPGYARERSLDVSWTKIPKVKATTHHIPSVKTTPNPTPVNISPLLDSSLPYEVQHFILTTIQRILEEGCYAFASRWAQKALFEKNWTCAEQVELKTWRDELQSLLPQNAIASELKFSLASALKDAVAIRNAATHRHLCDNIEIKKMTLQAHRLMEIFEDFSRQGKLQRLWSAIMEWDTESLSMDIRREKLELALQEVSERPVNDMDWSPNIVQDQETVSRDTRSHDHGADDPMDMD